MNRHALRVGLALLLTLGATASRAQNGERWEVATDVPEFRGVRADVPIPAGLHQKNDGSDVDQAGLCVPTSLLINGAYQGVPGMELGKDSAWWKYMKSRPGGSYPGKLEADVRALYPNEKWISWEGRVTDLIVEYTRKGYPVAATMNTGQIYDWRGIHHFVSPIHLRDGLACVVDSNRPKEYRWMAEADYQSRFIDGEKGWLFIWLRNPRKSTAALTVCVLSIAAAALCVCGVAAYRPLDL